MTTGPRYCSSCGTILDSSSRFCATCGTPIRTENEAPSVTAESNRGFFKKYWERSIKARIFYGLWVLLNVSNILALFSAASEPVDRFRSVCGWEGVSCGPSSQDRMGQAVLNLIIWNSLFWGFRFFYKKRQKSD